MKIKLPNILNPFRKKKSQIDYSSNDGLSLARYEDADNRKHRLASSTVNTSGNCSAKIDDLSIVDASTNVPFRKTPTKNKSIDSSRRRLVGGLLAGSGLAIATQSKSVSAVEESAPKADEELRFPGDPVDHKVVYQFNKAEEEYHNAVLFSVGAMLRKYQDNIHIVVVGIGPGIHIMAKKPKRPVSNLVRQRVASLLQYGVEFHACGNTMKSLGWTMKDMLESAKYVEVGAADLMELQQNGYSYISW